MPIYQYELPDGSLFEEFFHSFRQAPDTLTVHGRKARRMAFTRPTARRSEGGPSAYPLLSDAMGCHPDDIPERSRAFGVKFTPDGRAVIRSRQEYRRVAGAMGFRDS